MVDPREVDQIVDQADQLLDLARDQLVFTNVRGHGIECDQIECDQDRRERISQLVTEHRQEFVLGAVARLRLGLARAQRRLAGAELRGQSLRSAARFACLLDEVVGAQRRKHKSLVGLAHLDEQMFAFQLQRAGPGLSLGHLLRDITTTPRGYVEPHHIREPDYSRVSSALAIALGLPTRMPRRSESGSPMTMPSAVMSYRRRCMS